MLDILAVLEYNISENLIALSRVAKESGPVKPGNQLYIQERC